MSQRDALATWVVEHWQGNTQNWFRALVDADLIGFDWPAPHGANWARQAQYDFVCLLSKHQCPLMPESLTVIAPLLNQFGSDVQKRRFLPAIQANPLAWSFNDDSPNHCWLELSDKGDETLMIAGDGALPEILGQPGKGVTQLAQAVSPALLLQEYLLGQAYLQGIDIEETSAVTELRLQADILTAHFLRDNPVTDAQLTLLVSRSRLTLFSELFDALGYYALIEAPTLPGDNEPIPFAHERHHLQVLRTLTSRDEIVQQDQIYKEHLNAESD